MMLTTLEGFEILDLNDSFAKIMDVVTAEAIGKTALDIEFWQAGARPARVRKDAPGDRKFTEF